MNESDYLRRLKHHLLPLPRNIRREILKEITSHLNEARLRGGKGLVTDTLHRFGPPSKLAQNYIRIWGVSTPFMLIAGALGLVLGTLSAPLELSFYGFAPPPPIPALFYILLLLLIVILSYWYGHKLGIAMGTFGALGYLSNVIMTYELYRDWTTFTGSDIYTMAFNILFIPASGIVVGYLGERFWELEIEKEV